MMKCSQPDFQINGFRSQDEKTPVHTGCVCLQRLEALGEKLIVLPQGHLKAKKRLLASTFHHCESAALLFKAHSYSSTSTHCNKTALFKPLGPPAS